MQNKENLEVTPKKEEEHNTVVIVDDDEDLLKILTFSFEAENFQVYSFKTGQEAMDFLLDKVKIKTVSLIILDRMLPDMDGMEILNKISKAHSTEVPVLFLSVLSSEKDVLAGFKQGAVDYIPKPFNLNILMRKALSLVNFKNK